MSRLESGTVGTLAGLGVLLLILGGAGLRVDRALSNPHWSPNPDRLLKSDPGLLYYVTDRIVESGGLPPPDFRNDPRIEHPEPSDIPAMFTVGQEFLVAWVQLTIGGGPPLHLTATWVMALLASLATLGVYGLARELLGSPRLALLAAALFASMPASYRTISYVLMREDASLPLFTIHLWLLARAARLRTRSSFALAAGAGIAALATWHAMGVVLALEALALFAMFLLRGRSPFAVPHAWVFGAVAALGALVIPVLSSKLALLSFPAQIAAALGVAAVVERFGGSATRIRAAGLGGLGAAAGIAFGIGQLLPGSSDYSHVIELLRFKLQLLGQLPDDPTLLPFGARLLWSGPFATSSVPELLSNLLIPGILLPVAWLSSRESFERPSRSHDGWASLVLLSILFTASALLVSRTMILTAVIAPVLAASVLGRSGLTKPAAWISGLLLIQSICLAANLIPARDAWYETSQQDEISAALDWVRASVPPDAVIATDFVNSTAVLAGTRRSVVLQPKYETQRSRDRIERFVFTFHRRSPEEFRRLLREEFESDYFLLDRDLLGYLRYMAGIPYAERTPRPGTASAAFFPEREPPPGFSLVYRSSLPRSRIRIYALE